MIACISPCSSSSNHTLNTLWYADRLKNRDGDERNNVIEEEKADNFHMYNINRNKIMSEEEIEQVQKLRIKKDEKPLKIDKKESVYEDEEEEDLQANNIFQDDMSIMKETLLREKEQLPEEFFEFHERVNQLMEDQDKLINYHMKVIKV